MFVTAIVCLCIYLHGGHLGRRFVLPARPVTTPSCCTSSVSGKLKSEDSNDDDSKDFKKGDELHGNIKDR